VLFESGFEWRYEAGEISSEAFHREFERQIDRRVDFETLWRAGCDIFWRNESMEAVVRDLRRQGYPLVLISNTNEAHFEWVQQHFAVLEHFPKRALSYRVGACKPDRRMFETAVREAGVPAERCFYVDDVAEYVVAARELGIEGVHYTGTTALVAQLERRGIQVTEDDSA
jgi:FMN phosphatase YigB (HAD superfamily)